MGTSTPDPAAVKDKIGTITDPEIGRTLAELKMVEDVTVGDDGRVSVKIQLPTPAYPERERITQAIGQTVEGNIDVEYTFDVKGKGTGGAIGLNVKNIIAVGSGKGGVGKSTVAASLACGLKHLGAKVGLMDADVYGPSIPHMLGATGQPAVEEHELADGRKFQKMLPIEVNGLKVMSMGFMVSEEQAVIWRGPMLHKALSQFLQQTEWGELDYLVIDMPPGTGDVALTLSQLVGLTGAIVVCTPQKVALLDAVKAISMFRQVKIPVLGIVENMSGDIFGRGGAREKAAETGIPFLGEVPSNAEIRIKGDAGEMDELFATDNPAREHMLRICEQVGIGIARELLKSPSMPTLEIL